VAEFALMLPLILFLLLGMIELGNALAVSHTLSKLSREGASIASRGTDLDTVVSVLSRTGTDIHLAERGGTVVSRVQIRADGPRVLEQVSTPGFSGLSEMGTVGQSPVSLAAIDLQPGNTHYVVEVFYYYRPVTPFARLFESALQDPIYDRAIF
jgi:hypothetical protein